MIVFKQNTIVNVTQEAFGKMDKKGHQSIDCEVKSCNYNCEHRCSLDAITVDPIKNGNTGKACDESMCGSYKKKC